MLHFPLDDLEHVSQGLVDDVEVLRGAHIFITGSTGFIGKGLLEVLLYLNDAQNLNLKIFSISRNPDLFFLKYPHLSGNKDFTLFYGDINNDLSNLDITRIDFLIHAATDVAENSEPEGILKACIVGTKNVLNLAKKCHCRSFLLISSGSVYGPQPDYIDSLSEDFTGGVSPYSPSSAYALGKQASEWLVIQSATKLMEVKVARGFAFLGPYLPLDRHFAIGNFINAALRNHTINISGNGMPLRTYLYSSDLNLWIIKILLIGRSQGIWNIGGSERISISELAFLVKRLLNSDSMVSISNKLASPAERYIPDIRKIALELKLVPSVSLEAAILKTAEWNLKHGDFK